MDPKDVKLIRLGMDVIIFAMANPDSVGDIEPTNDLDLLRNRLRSLYFEHDLDESVARTRAALRAVSERLVAAHDKATAISVTGPTDQQVAEFKQALDALHEDIRGEQRFRAAFNLIVSLKDTVLADA